MGGWWWLVSSSFLVSRSSFLVDGDVVGHAASTN
jgi:hypothetical protein